MAAIVKDVPRVFRLNGVQVPDLAPTLAPEEVVKLLATQYPDAATATLTGPTIEDGKQVYTLNRAVGSKG
jgi:PRTRC genetic system protein C